jgi:hypothetical protein
MTTLNEDLDAAVALESLLSEFAEEAFQKLPTQTETKADYLAAINQSDLDKLLELQETSASVIDQAVANVIDLDNLAEMTPERAEALMAEVLDLKKVKAFIELRNSLVRAAVFAEITRRNAEKKVVHPDKAPGEVAVPTMGMKFTREGGKLKAQLSKEEMAKHLTKEQFARVYPTVHVPARVEVIEAYDEQNLDEEALSALVLADPAVMEAIRASVIPNGFTPSSFHQRKLTKKD